IYRHSRGNFAVRYNSEDQAALNKFTETLSGMLLYTREQLAPLRLPKVEVFLYKTSDIPRNYTFTSKKGKDSFPIVLFYGESKELDLTCSEHSQLCEFIFATVPHELAHLSLSPLIGSTATPVRWFDEGVAKFVEARVAQRFATEVWKRDCWNTFPRASLHRAETRER